MQQLRCAGWLAAASACYLGGASLQVNPDGGAEYLSPWSNPLVPTFTKREIGKDPHSKRFDLYERANFAFSCPGESLLVGIESEYKYFQQTRPKENSSDRRFRFRCEFVHAVGETQPAPVLFDCPSEIGSRKWPPVPPTDQLNSPRSYKMLCQNRNGFVRSFSSRKYYISRYFSEPLEDLNDEKNQQDKPAKNFHRHRDFDIECCNLATPTPAGEIQPIVPQRCTQSPPEGTELQQRFRLRCPANSYIREVRTRHSQAKLDRAYQIVCCDGHTVPASGSTSPPPGTKQD